MNQIRIEITSKTDDDKLQGVPISLEHHLVLLQGVNKVLELHHVSYQNLLDHQVGCSITKKEQQCVVKIDPTFASCHSKSFVKQNLWEELYIGTKSLFDVKSRQEFCSFRKGFLNI